MRSHPRRVRPTHGLVEADRGLDQPGEFGVLTDVLFAERLLDQEQIEGVELRELFGIGERVCRVGIDLQGDVTELFTDCPARR